MEIPVENNENGEIDEGDSTPNDGSRLVQLYVPTKRGTPSKGKLGRNNLPAASGSGQLKLTKTMPDPGAHGRWTNKMQYLKTSVLGPGINHVPGYKFLKDPVNPWKMNIPEYYNYIMEPMDITSIRQRLNNRYYKSADDCIKDVQLMFCNCYIYNRPDTQVVKLARHLELFIIRKLIDMPEVEEDYVRGLAVDGQRTNLNNNSINKEIHNEGEIQPFDFTAPAATPSPSVSGSGRQSLRLREVKGNTNGNGGKVLRQPEEEANASDSEESYKSLSTGEEGRDDDDEEEVADNSSSEVSDLLNKMEERKTERIQHLLHKLADTEQHIKRYLQAQRNDAKKLKRLRRLKKGTTANLRKRARPSSCSSSDARNKDYNKSPAGKKPETKEGKVSTPSKANIPSASTLTSTPTKEDQCHLPSDEKVGNGEPEKPASVAATLVVTRDIQLVDIKNASDSEDDGILDIY